MLATARNRRPGHAVSLAATDTTFASVFAWPSVGDTSSAEACTAAIDIAQLSSFNNEHYEGCRLRRDR